jgi:cytochrome c oxidase subunit 2
MSTTQSEPVKNRRVLIASSHPLFGQGLRSLLQERQTAGVEVVGMVSNLEEALQALDQLDPDLIIVDYDDKKLNRDEFLARFVEGEKKLRVVLLSLQSAQEAIVYDRRTLAAAQIDDWLEEWTFTEDSSRLAAQRGKFETIMDHRRTFMKNRLQKATHLLITGFLVVIVTALLIFGMDYIRLLPTAASAQAEPIDQLFHLEFKVIAFLFSLIVVFMLYSIIVFRRKRGDTTDAEHIEGSTNLEVAWTVAPLATVLVFAYLGGSALAATVAPAPKPLRVEVIGKQWNWSFVYPDYGVISDKLYLPVDKQAVLLLRSDDVIHSFWVPEFRVKQDALPGGQDFVRELRVTPTQLGEFKVRCAELCGAQHTYMESPVLVVAQTDFDAWLTKEAGLSDDPVERGQKWSTTFGCASCHSIDGTKIVGPSWKDLCEGQATLADGSVIPVDENYLRESILNPNAKIVQGFAAGIMPQQFIDPVSKKPITDQQISDIIAYMNSICR